jgi:hypothetical protein
MGALLGILHGVMRAMTLPGNLPGHSECLLEWLVQCNPTWLGFSRTQWKSGSGSKPSHGNSKTHQKPRLMLRYPERTESWYYLILISPHRNAWSRVTIRCHIQIPQRRLEIPTTTTTAKTTKTKTKVSGHQSSHSFQTSWFCGFKWFEPPTKKTL